MRVMGNNRSAPALFWGASVGLLFAALSAVIIWIFGLLFFNDEATISPLLITSVILLAWLAPGIAAGVTAHILLIRTGGAPRLTWFMLTVLFAATNLLAMIVARPFIFFVFSSQAPSAVQILSPIAQVIIAYVLWFFLATLGLRKALALAEKDDRQSLEAAPSIAGQLALALFIIMSSGAGGGTLMVGIAIGLPGMLILAAWATARRERGRRSGAFLLRVWSTPLVTVTLGIPILIILLG